MQEAVETTYPVNVDVLTSIRDNPNILQEAIAGLVDKWVMSTRETIEGYITATTVEEKATEVESGYETEATDINTARGEFVSQLEGTGMVGTTTE